MKNFYYNLVTTPLYFVRSGDVILITSQLGGTGVNGYSHASSASPKYYTGVNVPSAFFLRFDKAASYTSGGPDARWIAFPLRCLNAIHGTLKIFRNFKVHFCRSPLLFQKIDLKFLKILKVLGSGGESRSNDGTDHPTGRH